MVAGETSAVAGETTAVAVAVAAARAGPQAMTAGDRALEVAALSLLTWSGRRASVQLHCDQLLIVRQ